MHFSKILAYTFHAETESNRQDAVTMFKNVSKSKFFIFPSFVSVVKAIIYIT